METSTTHPEMPKPVEPGRQHEWLNRMVGEWTYEHECVLVPGDPPSIFKGKEIVRSLGGLWIVAEGGGDMPGGGKAITMMTLGYNPETQRFVGTWVGSMMTHLWLYDGELDTAERVLCLTSNGPDCDGKGNVPYQDRIEFIDEGHRTLTSLRPDEDGQWKSFMTAHYHRTK